MFPSRHTFFFWNQRSFPNLPDSTVLNILNFHLQTFTPCSEFLTHWHANWKAIHVRNTNGVIWPVYASLVFWCLSTLSTLHEAGSKYYHCVLGYVHFESNLRVIHDSLLVWRSTYFICRLYGPKNKHSFLMDTHFFQFSLFLIRASIPLPPPRQTQPSLFSSSLFLILSFDLFLFKQHHFDQFILYFPSV